jgi:hypothetical protein
VSTSDEENTENVESEASEAIESPDAASEAVEAPVDASPEALDVADESHANDHGHTETHFPMDHEEEFDRQLVSNYSQGGHEFDPPMARGLMIFTGSLTLIILLCAVGIMQMFKAEKNAMLTEQSSKFPKSLLKLRSDNANKLTVAGKSEKRNTITVTIDEAKKSVAGNPALLNAFVNPPAPKGKEAK